MAEASVHLAGAAAVLDSSGAMWLPACRTLVVSDLHLEKASSFARRGMFLPPYDTAATLSLLAEVVRRRDPRRIVSLGDSFHDRGGHGRLSVGDLARLAELRRGRDWIWVTGNHDPVLPDNVGGDVVSELAWGAFAFRHEPAAHRVPREVAGHLHPAAKVRGPGRSVRRRAFATDGSRIVLPAFGVLAGGLNVLDAAFARLFAPGALRAFLIGGDRLFPVAGSMLSPD
ncbi:MAG TPA: ligase-associated DNA damage response endonuclease PdeM [Propylenella sp.]|jgi:DNA ligase-associated metallophosphoesterase